MHALKGLTMTLHYALPTSARAEPELGGDRVPGPVSPPREATDELRIRVRRGRR